MSYTCGDHLADATTLNTPSRLSTPELRHKPPNDCPWLRRRRTTVWRHPALLHQPRLCCCQHCCQRLGARCCRHCCVWGGQLDAQQGHNQPAHRRKGTAATCVVRLSVRYGRIVSCLQCCAGGVARHTGLNAITRPETNQIIKIKLTSCTASGLHAWQCASGTSLAALPPAAAEPARGLSALCCILAELRPRMRRLPSVPSTCGKGNPGCIREADPRGEFPAAVW